MDQSDWDSAADLLFERSATVIRQFTAEHPDELFATFEYSVDCEYSGVALNFDTLENSLARAKRAEKREIEERNRLFATERGWKNSRYAVSHFTNRIDACNLRDSFKYDLAAFVELPLWENLFNGGEDCRELEGRIIVCLWRVADRLIKSRVFDGLRQSYFFRVAFSFHDDEMIVLRILNWPETERQAVEKC